MSDVTRILNAIGGGDSKAAQDLLPLVYEELRKLAAHKMANEAPGQTLQPTALVHEAWLRLVGTENPQFEGRGRIPNSKAVGISLRRRRRRCGASSSIARDRSSR